MSLAILLDFWEKNKGSKTSLAQGEFELVREFTSRRRRLKVCHRSGLRYIVTTFFFFLREANRLYQAWTPNGLDLEHFTFPGKRIY